MQKDRENDTEKKTKYIHYLAGKVDKEMIDPVKSSDARLDRLMEHLSCQYRHDGRHIKVCVGLFVTAATSQINPQTVRYL